MPRVPLMLSEYGTAVLRAVSQQAVKVSSPACCFTCTCGLQCGSLRKQEKNNQMLEPGTNKLHSVH